MAFKSKNLVLRKLIVLIMGVLILSTPVFAATEKTVGVTLNYSKVRINAGDSFTQTIGFEKFSGVYYGIQSFKFVINYDTKNFDYKLARFDPKGLVGYLQETPSDNKLVILYLSASPGLAVKGPGPLLVITFTSKKDAKSGTYDFGFGTGTTSTFVDCDKDSQNRDVKPILPAVLTQKITVNGSTGDTNDPGYTIPSSSSSVSNSNSSTSGSTILNNPVLVEQIKRQIVALPDKITEKDKAAVEKINKAINGLSPSDKDKIINNEKLKQANEEIDKLTKEGSPTNIAMIFIFIGLGLVLVVATFLIVKVIRGSKINQ